MKKVISLFLTLVLILSAATYCFADEGEATATTTDVNYTLPGDSFEVTIPPTLEAGLTQDDAEGDCIGISGALTSNTVVITVSPNEGHDGGFYMTSTDGTVVDYNLYVVNGEEEVLLNDDDNSVTLEISSEDIAAYGEESDGSITFYVYAIATLPSVYLCKEPVTDTVTFSITCSE